MRPSLPVPKARLELFLFLHLSKIWTLFHSNFLHLPPEIPTPTQTLSISPQNKLSDPTQTLPTTHQNSLLSTNPPPQSPRPLLSRGFTSIPPPTSQRLSSHHEHATSTRTKPSTMSSPLQATIEAGPAGEASNFSEADRRFLESAFTCLKSPPEVSLFSHSFHLSVPLSTPRSFQPQRVVLTWVSPPARHAEARGEARH